MTEYLARACGRRRWITIAVWLALAALAVLVSGQFLEDGLTTEAPRPLGNVESERAERLLEERLRGPEPITEFVIVQSQTLTVDDPAFRDLVESLHAEVAGLGGDVVAQAFHYYQTGDESMVSADRGATYMPVVMTGNLKEAERNVEHILHIVDEANSSEEFRVLTGGRASISFESNELAREDLEQGERFGIPVALIILLLLFGAVAAALVPLVLAVIAIVIALGLAALIGQTFELVFFVTLMITMIGLAVGIDYSLIIISRFREEMSAGLDKIAAVTRTGATAGRTVLFSGLTVMIAISGMLMIPEAFFRSIAIGAMVVVFVAVLATLTLLPATLALLGPRVNFLSLPFFGRARTRPEGSSPRGFWEAVTSLVMRFPLISIVAVGAPMIALIVVFFDIETGLSGVDSLPEKAQTREAFFILEEKFSFGLLSPTEVVIDADISNPRVSEAIHRLQDSVAADARFPVPPALAVNPERNLALLTVAIPGEPSSRAALDGLEVLRNEHIDAAFAGAPATVLVGGATSVTSDLYDIVRRYTPIVFAFVLLTSFIILMLVFRSVVIPVKAVVMNLLSVGAAYGLLVLVFQKGVGAGLLGFQETEVIDFWIPLFLFSVLFGLSMDYHVFLLSRIRERFDHTGNNAESVAYGLRSTASLITGAALIMVVVFGGFAAGDMIVNQQVGFGLAVAILLDATLVRSVLVPASMELLGRGNWYLPSWLGWLPDVRVEPAPEPSRE